MLISELGMAVSQLALGIYFHSLAQILEGAAPPPLLALPPLAVGQTALPHLIEGAASLFNSTQRQATELQYRELNSQTQRHFHSVH
jgi:hypothetical protein